MTKIQIMDEILANKIAAGEVVEKCASVVKELVENSIDAGANEIKIELLESGVKEIKITDNGSGMDKEDAVLAFQRHATSKIKEEKDLYNINTLGFRGEALASIASVSRVELKTSTGDAGTNVFINGGKVEKIGISDARKGTMIAIRDLFYNTPARLKYLKSLYTELANITSFINKLALSNPNIKFTLINNETEILKTDGSNNLLKVIMAIYGANVTKGMNYIEGENSDYKINGFISLPEINRSNRNHIITLVNGRVVKNNEVNKTINDSYHTHKPDNLYPIVVLNIEVDPTLIDVNIHPTKQDIKFSKLEELNIFLKELIREKLDKKVLIPRVEVEDKIFYNDFKETYPKEDFYFKQEEVKTEEKKETYQDSFKLEITNENVKREMPLMYPVGTVFGTYLIAQNEEGMYLIDQHAAKERVNYEIFKRNLGTKSRDSINFLFPISLEFTPDEYIILKENLDILINIGFIVEEFGINSIIVKSHPIWLPKNYEEKAIRKIIELIIEKEKNFNLEKFNENLAINLSCKLSIKANDNISIKEMEELINDLRKCENPYNCPHGRPTVILYSKYDLEKLFKRSGF